MSEKTNHMQKSDKFFVLNTLEVTEQVTNIRSTFNDSSVATSQNINKTRKMFMVVISLHSKGEINITGCRLPYVVIASQCSCIRSPLAPVFLSAPPLSLHIQLFYKSRTAPPALEFLIIHLDTGSQQISRFLRMPDQTSQKDSAMTTHYMLQHTSVHDPVEAPCSYCI